MRAEELSKVQLRYAAATEGPGSTPVQPLRRRCRPAEALQWRCLLLSHE